MADGEAYYVVIYPQTSTPVSTKFLNATLPEEQQQQPAPSNDRSMETFCSRTLPRTKRQPIYSLIFPPPPPPPPLPSPLPVDKKFHTLPRDSVSRESKVTANVYPDVYMSHGDQNNNKANNNDSFNITTTTTTKVGDISNITDTSMTAPLLSTGGGGGKPIRGPAVMAIKCDGSMDVHEAAGQSKITIDKYRQRQRFEWVIAVVVTVICLTIIALAIAFWQEVI